ncbi:MAG: His-Xaa-Ser system protein HxsD [Bacilli bacterium]|nr:His-Xaa-Ser system protein HxsD [Bacilli bacterium]
METKTITIDTNIYSLRAVLSAAYVFLNDYYFFLNQPEEGKIKIDIKGKNVNVNLNKIEGEFNNELINVGLRQKVFEENRKVREMIVNIALNGIDKNSVVEERPFCQNDPDGISKRWEDSVSNTHIAIEKPKGVNFSANFVKNKEKNGN